MKEMIRKRGAYCVYVTFLCVFLISLKNYTTTKAEALYETFGIPEYKIKTVKNNSVLKVEISRSEEANSYVIYICNDLYGNNYYESLNMLAGKADYDRDSNIKVIEKYVSEFKTSKKTVKIKNLPEGTYNVAVVYNTKSSIEGVYSDINWKKIIIKNRDASAKQKKSYDFSNVKKGDVIEFGEYEQDLDYYNGKEPIKWIVLSKEDDRILVLSKYIIDILPYNWSTDVVCLNEAAEATWDSCSLRTWLNKKFYKYSFDKTEKKLIMETTVKNEINIYSGIDCGKDTKDKVFLPSLRDMINSEYGFSENWNEKDLARIGVLSCNKERKFEYWLRTTRNYKIPEKISESGMFERAENPQYNGNDGKNCEAWGIRPCMYIKIK